MGAGAGHPQHTGQDPAVSPHHYSGWLLSFMIVHMQRWLLMLVLDTLNTLDKIVQSPRTTTQDRCSVS